jgi:hypothetical protein
LAKVRWVEARQAEILPTPYFHVVFTLPHPLNALAQGNPRVLYTLLFRAAAATLLAFGRDPRHLGGTIGVTAILHTWGQTLCQHLHLHCVVTGGALSADGQRWVPAHPRFLFPVQALSRVFRGKYLDALRAAFDAGQLTFAAGTAPLADPARFAAWVTTLRAHDWVVYAKPPFAGAAHVLEYLGRYTHRIALSNTRLVDVDEAVVRFRWRDYADDDRVKVMALPADEFIRRFLLHVLPQGFVRIRHFGLLANRRRHARLDQVRALLHQPPGPSRDPAEPIADLVRRLTGIDLDRCPICRQGRMQRHERVPAAQTPWNTS